MFNPTILGLVLILTAPLTPQTNSVTWTEKVEKHLDLYSVIPALRDPAEYARVRNKTLFVNFRRNLSKMNPSDRSKALCEGTRWLIVGRRANSKGLGSLLEVHPEIETVKLVFYAVETSVKLNRKSRYDQKRKLVPQMILTVDRTRISQLNSDAIRKNLSGENCAGVANAVLTKIWHAK